VTRTLSLALASFAVAAIAAAAPPGKLVDMDGYRLHLYCTGAGSPTVVLEAGANSGFFSWWTIQPRIAQSFRVCSYDRAGIGFSDARPGPRSGVTNADDLHALLERAGEHPPYLLVGHSLGTRFVRLFAERFQADVEGMVLLDPVHEDAERVRPPDVGAALDALRDQIVPARKVTLDEGHRTGKWPAMNLPNFLPKLLASELRQLTQTAKWWEARDVEADLPDSEEIVPPERRCYDFPLIVINATRWDKPATFSDAVFARWTEHRIALGKELASRSRRGKHVVLDVNHGIHWDAPDAVLQAIADVTGESLAPGLR
jgi:pimeloyl-ACP methyl ester carboxylesterase